MLRLTVITLLLTTMLVSAADWFPVWPWKKAPAVTPAPTISQGNVTPLPLMTPPPLKGAPSTPPSYAPILRPDGRWVVALDIGHTVLQPGAISASGVPEFEFNRRIVGRVEELLRDSKTVTPVVINPTGEPITLSERSRRAAMAGAALFLAIHHDSVADKYLLPQEINGRKLFYCDRFKGFGVFMSQKNLQPARSLDFARLLGTEMLRCGFEFSPHHHEAIQGENRPIIDRARGVYQYDDLIVLKTALMPAALLECGIIVNREQEILLGAPATQQQIAEAIAAAIERFFVPPK